MRFPTTNKQGKRRVNIPEFTGGLNLRDNPTQCNDNQLTDMLNMWYKDGALRTRPSFNSSAEMLTATTGATQRNYGDIRFWDDISYEDGNERYVMSTLQIITGDEAVGYEAHIHFRWQGENEIIDLPTLAVGLTENKYIPYFVVEKSGVLYCFADGDVYKFNYSKDEEWSILDEAPPIEGDEDKETIYAPLVLYGGTYQEDLEPNGTNLEAFNLIGRYYRIVYSTVNKSILNDTVKNHKMEYGLLSACPDKDETTSFGVFIAWHTDKYGVRCKHIAMRANELSDDYLEQKWDDNTGGLVRLSNLDGLSMRVSGKVLSFEKINTTTGQWETASVQATDYVEDNLEITAPDFDRLYDTETKNKIFNMTRAVWYGGASAGLAGGTRLFLCGNTNEKEKALVCWSGLNNPLYFPENSYFYVGNTSEAVTGFGKQSDMLVLFKNNETWYTQYTQNTSITAEDLIDQRVIDLQANAVYFPLVLINPSIGCAYPNTVQLCRNRLVFMGSDKKVYTLVSNNQYNERSIYCVSEMVDRELKDSFTYYACDWNGYYCLSSEDKLYLMDYNSYGYQYISSYSKTEDSNKKIPWYIWEIPNGDYSKIGVIGDTLVLSQYFDSQTAYSNIWLSYYVDGSNKGYDEIISLDDNGGVEFIENDIDCFIKTKLFDFGEPNSFKNISSVGLSLGYNGGRVITVTFITDGGIEQDGVYLDDEAEERMASFTKSQILSPAIRAVVRFGVKLKCEGNMIIDGATIDYRVTGRAY